MSLAPELRRTLLDALESAFPDPITFDTFLLVTWSRDLESFASRNLARPDLYCQVIVRVAAEGWIGQLLARINEERPDNQKVQNALKKWRKSVLAEGIREVVPSRLPRHSPDKFFGRGRYLKALDAAWNNPRLNVYTLVAWGGIGKTSLVAHWVSQRMAADGWPGVERYFDWSFHGQSTGESLQSSSDPFINEALKSFGDADPSAGNAWDRGARLAGLVRRHRTLLVLDGIETLQYPPMHPHAGQLTDPALEALLHGLAADNPGLCIVTTRAHLKNLEDQPTTREQKLESMGKTAAMDLLRHLKIVGSKADMEAAWKNAGGHALTLQLLGRYIADAYEDRDIRHFKDVKFTEADQHRQGRSVVKMMATYERWLQSAGPEHQRGLAILRLTGLFDRPISRACLQVLRAEPAIAGLTEALVKLTDPDWNLALNRLKDIDLLTVTPGLIDVHPLIREYFAARLHDTQPDAFRTAHSRLYVHLCATQPHRPETLDGLQPLFQAVVHGCQAGLHQEVFMDICRDRILGDTRLGGFHGLRIAGVLGSNLAALTSFFSEPWLRPHPSLEEWAAASVLGVAGYCLRGLGRLTEAAAPLCLSMEKFVAERKWLYAALAARELGALEGTMGSIEQAVGHARRSVEYAERGSDLDQGIPEGEAPANRERNAIDARTVAYHRMLNRALLAHALHQSGDCERYGGAEALFREAERRQAEWRPEYRELRCSQGFHFCELLLASAERAAWAKVMQVSLTHPDGSDPRAALDEGTRQAVAMAKTKDPEDWPVDNALHCLALGRSALYRWLLSTGQEADAARETAREQIETATVLFRKAGHLDELPKGLLTRAWLRVVLHRTGANPGLTGSHEHLTDAEADLAEAEEIAERGPMPLYLADVHLHRARLFRLKTELRKAIRLVMKHGYGRRKAELEDAKRAARNWPA